MKKLITGTFLLLLITGCSSNNYNSENELNLLGIWQNSVDVSLDDIEQDIEEGEYVFVQQIEFLADNTFEQLTFLVNKTNQEVIGYSSRNDGTYEINGNRLLLNYDSYYSNTESSSTFVSINDLILAVENQEESFDFYFGSNNDTLTFDFDPCPANAVCLDQIEFQRT